ncbi:MAG TPA: amidohydrolase family protein [Chloroflexota bacterium]|nr:amidohydrolase family protein [Chloroflexota bacterium]
MAQVTVLRAAHLIDGTGADPTGDGAVVIVDGEITAVGPVSSLNLPSGAGVRNFDYPGCTLLPGLIDSHTHLLFSASDQALDDAIRDSDETLLLRGLANAQAELRCGVTTLRDCGGRGFLTVALRDGINRGLAIGPRVLAAAMPLTTTGGHLNFCGLEADGVPEVIKATRRLCKGGVDFIKVVATGGGMTPGTNSRAPQFSVEELTAIVGEAQRLGGRHVAAHCHATQGIRNAVEAGIRTIEHCSWLHPVDGLEYDPRTVERMVEKGTYVSLTMGSERAAIKPDDQLADWQRRAVANYEPHFDLLRRTIRGGVRFIASSDAGVSRTFFDEYPLTLEVMVSCLDIAPMEALRATTGRAAEALGIANLVGALVAGRRGDVLVVEGNPLADIRALREVRAVYRDGTLAVDGDRLVLRPGPIVA